MSKILVVEDEKSMRDLLGLMLRKEGCEVDTAESADTAVTRIDRGGEYDLVISDISMPGMSGLELLRHSRRVAPDEPDRLGDLPAHDVLGRYKDHFTPPSADGPEPS